MPFMERGDINNGNVGALEDVATIETEGMRNLWLAFAVGSNALTAFVVEFKLKETGNWFGVVSVSGDFTTPVHPVVRASGSLVTAAVGNHFLKLDVTGVWAVRIRAAGSTSSIVGTFGLG